MATLKRPPTRTSQPKAPRLRKRWMPSSGRAPLPSSAPRPRKQSIGHEILCNLVDFEFAGPLYPVNPSAQRRCAR